MNGQCKGCCSAVLGTDGQIRFIGVLEGKLCCSIEPASQKQAYTRMAIDSRGNYSALITQEGEVVPRLIGLCSLHHLATKPICQCWKLWVYMCALG